MSDFPNGAKSPSGAPEAGGENAQLEAIFRKVLAENAPALIEAVTAKVLQTAQAQIEQRVKDAKAEVDAHRQAVMAQQPRQGEVLSPGHAEDTPRGIADSIRWVLASLPDLLSKSLESYDKFVTIRMKTANPFVMFEELKKNNPQAAAYIAQLNAPDPLQSVLPQLLAKNSLDTANAVAKTLMRQGIVPRGGRLAVDPFAEDSEELEPGSEQYDPQRSEPRQPSAEMYETKRRNAAGYWRGTDKGIKRGRPVSLREALR